ncbi:heme biosynthesis protein HemY [Roseivivax isoporae]|uniref:Heme biosynthesis protein HemY n=1 Tax=Roseivivax isoporae LMG 25204 TaxID=1449351 RepID=X7FA56_9RHOB|nr:heme biosynthesis HemY N-terminal domain-containing protein [Roseivivax isoporae]ETX29568.1 heme biosynthesis protein HemY [Roseivivax isoporae LMG 25204]
MLWSLIKIVLFVAIVAALTLGAGYLMDSTGGVMVTVAGTEYTFGPLQSVLAAIVLVVVLYVVFKLASLLVAILRFINGDDTALSRYFDRNRERKGYEALADGLTALSAGEGRLAMAKAQKAERYLHRPELTDLITAQAAEMQGDRRKAEETYKRLLKHDKTRFVGIRGIMHQRLAEGDTDTALQLAERAFALKPKHEEVQDVLLRLQAGHHDWKGARNTLNAKLRHGALPRDVHRRRDAVLALSEAKDVLDTGKSMEAREAAIAANKSSPDLIPAAAMAARALIADGEKKKAARILRKAWEARPHPDLAAAFAEIEPDETPAVRLRRFGQLTSINPSHRETRLLDAELHLAAEDFPGARRAMGDLAEKEPDARVLSIMAAIERGEGAPDKVVRGWLARALTAPRGPAWVCDNCNTIHADWVPICSNCEAFDSLSWKTPPQSEGSAPVGAEMLPLLVGGPEEEEKAPEPVDVSPPAATPEMAGTPSETPTAEEDPAPAPEAPPAPVRPVPTGPNEEILKTIATPSSERQKSG